MTDVTEPRAEVRADARHDAFISYSHHDTEFVRDLRLALQERGKEIWLDESGIRPAERWELALARAIEGANAFLFVISPEAAASPECRKELDHARTLQKRVIPVVARPTDPQQLPAEIASVQFVPGRGTFEDDFERSMELLLSAIDTDIEWVDEHTEWGLKAIEWDKHGRDSSFLLGGSELQAAERWLARQSGKRPQPTTLHNEFVLLSRQNATRRLRRTRAITSVALVIMTALAGIAFIMRSQAVSNQQVARSRQLAAEGVASLASDPQRSALLSLHALDVRATNQAENALRKAVPAIELERTFSVGSPVGEATYSADGRRVATAAAGGTAAIWDTATGHRLAVLREPSAGGLGSANFSVIGNSITAASFSHDGGRVLTASDDTTARVWDASSGRQLAVLYARDTLNDAAFNPAADEVVTAGEDGTVAIWSVNGSARELSSLKEPTGAPVRRAQFSADGTRVVTASSDGTARLWDARTGRQLRVIVEPRSQALSDAEFSPDGSKVVTASADGSARVWDASSGALLLVLGIRSGSNLQTARFSPDGEEIVTAGNGPTATVWDVGTGERLTELQEPQGPRLSAASFSPDGRHVLTSSNDGTARIWDASPRQLITAFRDPGRWPLRGAAFNAAGTEVAVGGDDGTARVFAASSGKQLAVMREGTDGSNFANAGNAIVSVAFSPDGRRLLTASRDGTARVWDAATGAQLRVLPVGLVVSSAAYNPAGTMAMATNDDGTLAFFDATSGRELGQLNVGSPRSPSSFDVLDASFSPDGKHVVTAGDDGTARILDLRTGRQLWVVHEPHDSPIGSARFGPGGRTILTASDDGTARIWDASSGRQLTVVSDPAGARFYDAQFSPDGTKIVTASGAGTATVWQARSGKELTSLGYTQGATFFSASFDRTGEQVITAGYDGLASVWSAALAAPVPVLKPIANDRVASGLSSAELKVYVAQTKS